MNLVEYIHIRIQEIDANIKCNCERSKAYHSLYMEIEQQEDDNIFEEIKDLYEEMYRTKAFLKALPRF